MAEYRFSPSVVSRGKGQSAIAKAAYNAREDIRDERTGEMKRHAHRPGLEWQGIFVPKDAPEWAKNRAALWNAVELREDQQPNKKNRAEAQLCRYIEVNLPHELNAEQRKQLVRDFVREQFQRKGMVADVAIHEPHAHGDPRNYHAHILLTMRELGPDGFGVKVREWNDYLNKDLNLQWREKWAELGARYLERAGFELEAERYKVGHLTLEKQRQAALERGDLGHAEALNHPPTKHLGPQLAAMERKGVETERGNIHRDIYTQDEKLAALKAELAAVEKQIAAEVREPTSWERWQTHVAEQLTKEEARRGFRRAGHENTERISAPDDLNRTAARIWEACQRSDSPRSFVAALEDSGLLLARATKEEARASEVDNHYAKQQGKFSPVYRDGEILVVNELANVYRLTPRTTGDEWRDIRKFMATMDPKTVPGIEATKQIMQDRAEAFDIERRVFRDLSGVGSLPEGVSARQVKQGVREVKREAADTLLAAGSAAERVAQTIDRGAKAAGKAAEFIADLAAGAIEFLGNMFGAIERTPEQIQAAVETREEAAAEAEIDWERFKADKDYRRIIEAREEQQLAAEREQRAYQQQRERDGPQR